MLSDYHNKKLLSLILNKDKINLIIKIPPREVEKVFRIAWPNIVCHIEDEASSVLDKKVKWYSDRHDNLTDDIRMAENKAFAKQDCR